MIRYLLLIFLIPTFVTAQVNQPNGYFHKDSMNLAEIVSYSLSVSHTANTEVYFPGKNHDFKPFKIVNIIYFPTITQNNTSKDSAVYQLQSFEIERFQKLSLPVFYKNREDSIAAFAPADSLFLIQNFGESVAELTIDNKIKLEPLQTEFNYWLVIAKIILIATAFVAWWQFYHKSIESQISIFQLNRQKNEFVKQFEKLCTNTNVKQLQLAHKLWKSFNGKLTNINLDTLTSAEIANELNTHDLLQHLRQFDMATYGNTISPEIDIAKGKLVEATEIFYIRKRKQLIA